MPPSHLFVSVGSHLSNAVHRFHACCLSLWQSRLGYGAVALMALSQRLPMPRVLASVRNVLSTPIPQMIKFTSPFTLTWAGMHTVTGGSPVLVQPVTGFKNPSSGTVGEEFTWAFRTIGEKAGSYKVEGLPPGIEYSGRVSSGVSSISGAPLEAGSFEVEITGYRGTNLTRDWTPVYTFILEITGESLVLPVITAHPQSGALSAGDNLTLTVNADGAGLTYQWSKDNNPIDGATESMFSVDSVQASDAGSYTATVTNDAGSVTTETAEITVESVYTYETWVADVFPESASSEEKAWDADFDDDGFINLTEFYLGFDPLNGDNPSLADLRLEMGANGAEWTYTVPVNPMLPGVPLLFERSTTLESDSWELLDPEVQGVSITRIEDTLSLRVDHIPGTMMFRVRTPGDVAVP